MLDVGGQWLFIGPVGILILHLEPYDRASVDTLQWNQDLEQSSEVSRHGLCIGSIVGHVGIMK